MGGKGGTLTTIGGAAQPGGWKQALGYYSFNVPDGCGCFNPNALTVHMLTDILREYWKDMCENRVYVEWGYFGLCGWRLFREYHKVAGFSGLGHTVQ